MLSGIVHFINELLLNLLSLLPGSPFATFIQFTDEYELLGFINWFIPFDFCVTIMEAWLSAIMAMYLYKNGSKVLKFFGL